MGACVPRQLLGPGGHLPSHQNSLEHLALVTNAGCTDGHTASDLALGNLNCLRTISWIGIRTKTEVTALGTAMRENAKHLQGLTLDFNRWDYVTSRWVGFEDPASEVSRLVFQVQPTSPSLQYPALAALSLSGLDITSYARGLACVTRSPTLRSITLRGCLGWDSFLQSLIEPGSKLAINTLEVYQPVRFGDPDDADEVVKAFLQSVDGLGILHMSLPSPCDTKACWRTMARHTSTLRQLVYHIRGVNLDDESRHFEEEMDMSDMSLISDLFFDGDSESDDEFDGGGLDDNKTDDSASEQPSLGHDPWFDERSPNPLGDLQLECIGLACRPARLVSLPLIHCRHGS